MKKIINLNLYSELSSSEKTEVLSFVATLVDKRVKFEYECLELKSFIVMLLALRNYKYTGATALEYEWIRKEFVNHNIKEKHIEERIDKLHSSKIITWEYRGRNFNQIRFSNEYKSFDNKYYNQKILDNY